MEFKFYHKIALKEPIMIAGWPGMGNVALGTVDYIRKKTNAKILCEIDISKIVLPEAVIVEDGIIKLPRIPKNIIYFIKEPDLLIVEGETQLYGKDGELFMNTLLKFARDMNVQKIFTGAAFPLPMSCKEEVKVYAATNNKKMRDFLFSRYRLKILEQGEISGLNGLLLGYAEKYDIPGACLLGTMPLYAIKWPNPKTSKAIIEVLEKILEIKIDMGEIEMYTIEIEKEMIQFEEKIQMQEKPIEQKQEIPDYVYQRIEKLFEEAAKDKSTAMLLKQELDKWNLFSKYEDRFLDLFKKKE